MIKNEEAEDLEAIIIDQFHEVHLETTIPVNAISKMKHLKLLILDDVNSKGSLNYLSNELRYLSWERYPSTCLPSNFHPDNLIELILHHSNLKQLWKGTKHLPNLIHLDLSYSKNLIEMPDLTGVPRLRSLFLIKCINITRIHPSIGILRELAYLVLEDCKNLFHNLNIIFGLKSLEMLNLSGCSKLLNKRLIKKPKEAEHLENVDKNTSVIQLSTSSSVYAIGSLLSLKTLKLGGNKFVRLPTTIKELSNLHHLNLQHCKQLKYLPELPTTKKNKSGAYYGDLYIFNCPNLSEMEHCYHMVFSWMIQIFKAFLQSSLSLDQLKIVIPGTQIPRWFSEQNVGRSISMDLSPVKEDPNWMGVACCSLFVAHDDPTNLNNNFGSIGYNFKNMQVLHNSYRMLPIFLNNDLVTDEIDHLFMVFFPREIISLYRNVYEDKMGFTTGTFEHPKGLHLEVKNCGYRLVFKEDLQQLNLNMMFSENSSSKKCKLLSSDSPYIIH
ncbi:disease resistance protein RML1B-like [Cajanus cajan]|uniref:disease resistance protein RML1B-like n=1 Tax=Cajanus cajan TaxID=3821 RepID=UPI0010FB5F88|nr:disease resistance protein RML1B-like [Cajanus cajan]